MSHGDNRAHDQAHPHPRLPADPPSAPAGTRRIAIISASVGAGHDGAAGELARGLEAQGFRVDRLDFLDLLPAGAGRLLCSAYRGMLTLAPSGYQRIYATTEESRSLGPGARTVFRTAEHRTMRALLPGTCAVVSTYPGASQVLGHLRQRGRLTVPALTYLTDFSVHGLWVAPGVDAHLAAHAVPAGQARAQGAAAVMTTGPVVGSRFVPAAPAERRDARARFGLPEDARLALLVAGSWGVGQVREAAAEIRDSGVAAPVVVCGRNQALADRLRQDGIGHVYGWVDDMPGLMHATDVLVQNAGGLTSLEAFAGGLPVASYRCIPGHGRTNAAALDEAGLAVWIREPERLGPVLSELIDGPSGRRQRARGLALYGGAGPVAAIAALAGQHAQGQHGSAVARPAPVRRPVRRTLTGAAAAVAVTASLSTAAPLVAAHHGSHVRRSTLTHVLNGGPR
ncbi:MGDG synthase family glycosyltransferase [Actinacidiphila acididurans]|uniref:UDP-N-acetylglucosamine--N-acetylglucosamine transferase n=1 Tax=Actinacidiphila acididurans TaxID=2784346 RepID=A0ABS2TY35_9ACTN|nr:UDP-N-acetylglucosamine--N-acetylglucosamine transferase [Actinacidiphila acididurans]MBM9508251.1 UDP-N-acetylglucosamine--N-acetylglucosamine transferase [Actinacidiphila acididurans]